MKKLEDINYALIGGYEIISVKYILSMIKVI